MKFTLKIVSTGMILIVAMFSSWARADHLVAIKPIQTVSRSLKLSFPVTADGVEDQGGMKSGRDYWLNVTLPKGVIPDLSVGGSVQVILPVVRNRETFAKVVGIEREKIRLRLPNQVQYLEGQTLSVSIPIKNTSLYEIPFQAIYSPRDGKTEVFVLDQDNKVQLVTVSVLQLMDDGLLVVSSPNLNNGSKVVSEGLENLGAGEAVQVVDTSKGSQK